MQSLLRLQPIAPVEWLVMAVLASIVLWVMEIYKAVQRRREVAAQT
jgi:uncharacterized membrane protein